MQTIIKKLLTFGLLLLSPALLAKSNQEVDKSTDESHYSFINHLGDSLKSRINGFEFEAVESVYTYQKDRQIIVSVVHNPYESYSRMVEQLASTSSRINGIKFENSFTLHILDNYCKSGLFYEIQAERLLNKVRVEYEDTYGQTIAVHNISKSLCS